VAGTFTATIGSATGTHYPFTAGTAVASTSGTSIDFTSIPSWVKRITVMFNGVSTNGTSLKLCQLGAGSVTSTGYSNLTFNTTGAYNSTTAGFSLYVASASDVMGGQIVFALMGSNTWTASGVVGNGLGTQMAITAGSVTLGGTLDRVRITTVNGTDTFDAGSINILYEG
jgi:hypothetical protein